MFENVKRVGSIWLFIFFKKNGLFEKIRETPQLFVNSICRKV